MRFKNMILILLQLAFFPVLLMGYGFYLGQLHQSMQDLAGILMFIIGIVSLIFALILHWLSYWTKWFDKWYSNVLIGVISSGIVFGMIVIYARMHG
jgi:hypothetical protein